MAGSIDVPFSMTQPSMCSCNAGWLWLEKQRKDDKAAKARLAKAAPALLDAALYTVQFHNIDASGSLARLREAVKLAIQ